MCGGHPSLVRYSPQPFCRRFAAAANLWPSAATLTRAGRRAAAECNFRHRSSKREQLTVWVVAAENCCRHDLGGDLAECNTVAAVTHRGIDILEPRNWTNHGEAIGCQPERGRPLIGRFLDRDVQKVRQLFRRVRDFALSLTGSVKTVDRFGESVIVTVTDAPDRGLDAYFGQAFGIPNGYALDAAVGMVDEPAAMDGPPNLSAGLEHPPNRRIGEASSRPEDRLHQIASDFMASLGQHETSGNKGQLAPKVLPYSNLQKWVDRLLRCLATKRPVRLCGGFEPIR